MCAYFKFNINIKSDLGHGNGGVFIHLIYQIKPDQISRFVQFGSFGSFGWDGEGLASSLGLRGRSTLSLLANSRWMLFFFFFFLSTSSILLCLFLVIFDSPAAFFLLSSRNVCGHFSFYSPFSPVSPFNSSFSPLPLLPPPPLPFSYLLSAAKYPP